jgi:acyl-coenzyme A synthetase/AMP-(fatty) acid ligase
VRQEVVASFISLNPCTMPSEALKIELRDFAKARLSSYKSPRRIEFVDALPRDTVGKVQTRLIKEKAALLLGPDV